MMNRNIGLSLTALFIFISIIFPHQVFAEETPRIKTALMETINNFEISDPFRNLENLETATLWLDSQNERTEKYLDSVNIPGLEERVKELFEIGYVSDPKMAAGMVFFEKLEKNAEQPSLLVMENGVEKVVLDLAKLDKSGKTAMDWFYPSPSGKLVALGLSKDGDERSTLKIIDISTGKFLNDEIKETPHCSIAWLHDDSGFYYTVYPKGVMYNRRVHFHKLGENSKDDKYIFGKQVAKTDWIDIVLSSDDLYLILNVSDWTTSSDCYLLDRKSGKFITIAQSLKGEVHGSDVRKGILWAKTTYNAPMWKLVNIEISNPSPENWLDILPERDGVLSDYVLAKNRIVALYKIKVVSRLFSFGFDGKDEREIKLPALGTVRDVTGQTSSKRVVFGYSSFLFPNSLFFVENEKEDRAKPLVMTPTGGRFNPDDFTIKYVEFPSYDGTLVPMFLVHKNEIALDGANPTLLYGYGGFGIERGAYFSRTNLFWIERGGVFAVAGIRGGGEFGEKWHKAGMEQNKFQVFSDFEYAMRFLIRKGYTRPEKLAIRGGSNGGLLVGAMITQNPHLFGCAIGQVGLYDMIRYHKFPPGELWISEYGSSDNPNQTGYLWAYSPYHQVLPGVKYPPTFIMTAESDSRVHWSHSAKFTAVLQDANNTGGPILFHLQKQAGHGQGMNWSDIIKEVIMVYKFVIKQIGDPKEGFTYFTK